MSEPRFFGHHQRDGWYTKGQAWLTMAGLLNSLTTYYVSVTLTASQIAALRETPVQLVAAQGSGQAIIPISAIVWFTGNSTGYTQGGEFFAWYGTTQPSSSNSVVSTSVVPLNDLYPAMESGTSRSVSGPWGINRAGAMSNQPIYIGLNASAASNWTGGNGTISMTVLVNQIASSF